MSEADKWYANLLGDLLCGDEAEPITTRNSPVRRLTDISTAFTSTPLVSIRKTPWKTALREWEWFMSGSNNINDLHPSVHPWWKPWADSSGEIRFNYSEQFRRQTAMDDNGHPYPFDQIDAFIQGIKYHPYSRRHVIATWYSPEMYSENCPITNCHGSLIQAFVGKDGLKLTMYQRSADVLVGLPANLIQYWAFLLWLASRTGFTPHRFTWIGGDVHLYDVHRLLAGKIYAHADIADDVPLLLYTPTSDDFKADDFALSGEYKWVMDERAEMVV